MFFVKVSLMFIVLNLFGCGSLSKKFSREQTQSTAVSAESSESKFENAFQGVWKAACDEKPDAAASLSTQYAMTVAKGRITQALLSFSEPSCRGPASFMAHTSTYTTMEESAANPGRQRVAVKLSGITALFQSQTFVDALNKSGYCGYHDWKVNEGKPISKSMPNCISQFDKQETYYVYLMIVGDTLKSFSQESDAQPYQTLSKYY